MQTSVNNSAQLHLSIRVLCARHSADSIFARCEKCDRNFMANYIQSKKKKKKNCKDMYIYRIFKMSRQSLVSKKKYNYFKQKSPRLSCSIVTSIYSHYHATNPRGQGRVATVREMPGKKDLPVIQRQGKVGQHVSGRGISKSLFKVSGKLGYFILRLVQIILLYGRQEII